ncbi:hypothetical protein JOC77_001041 [Peribacillus deserti]|uniref:HNH nuclease domain-containing protein n=1 Tax=Peribacillus deserti TaxID=673318 RepID=A0ABS2QFQ3_9BACI|nr:HNH endonuclease domain-containing protein [Peribacillus deserti]MBM7691634.1 hypothetical protein [Peribacillus deserti]
MSWKLQIGEIKESYLTEEDIWQAINNFFFRGHQTMSYKYGFFKSIIENLYNVNNKLEMSYDKLFYSFTKIYWNLVVHHGFRQSNNKNQVSTIQRVLQDHCLKNNIPQVWTFDKLPDLAQLKIINDIKKQGKRYVIGAFYGDTKEVFYAFDLKAEYIKLNPPVYKFLQKHQRTITYLINYHLAKFLERNNSVPSINYLLKKVEDISKRSSLEDFYNILIKYDEKRCFYCGKSLSNARKLAHVDHFIPWSFIQNDNLWNLVISCQTCNIKKKDKLADECFLETIVERNNHLINIVNAEEKDDFYEYEERKLISLYEYSKYNGYIDLWHPNSSN